MEVIIQIGGVVFLLILGFAMGSIAEKRHLARLAKGDADFRDMQVNDLRTPAIAPDPTKGAILVSGEAVISSDYFKTFLAKLKKFIGGELRSFESLLQRARREAVLRMMQQARERGYDVVCNVRMEGYDIAGASVKKKGGVTLVAVLVSGTAYKRAG